MPETKSPARAITLSLPGGRLLNDKPTLAGVFPTTSRGSSDGHDPFLDGVVQIQAVYQLSATARGDAGPRIETPLIDNPLLALEAADGTTIFIRADKLREDLQRLFPGQVGPDVLDLSVFRDRAGAERGLGDWIWNRLSILTLDRDAITDAARDKAMQWVKDKLGDQVEGALDAGASWFGAKALMWAIESRLAGKPGLYRWNGRELSAADRLDAQSEALLGDAQAGPMLVFIHGTGSHTYSSFKDLCGAGAGDDWDTLTRPFQGRVYGLEHPTFSESPIDNALMLARTLPAGARVSLVTHSRGGLVGDLFCLGGLTEDLIQDYRREAPINKVELPWQKTLRENATAEEQQKLRDLRDLLNQKAFVIDRYVRVACPAQGTRLLSDNLDVFLSGLLSIMGKLVGVMTGPAASPVFSAFKRIVLEIADKRVDARLVPGIEAMLADSPMATLLARAPRKQGVRMAVIAGTVEVNTGIFKRIGVMFTDWMFFDGINNDLVVDTESMYGGIAACGAGTLFDGGPDVSHFSYFRNSQTRGPLRDWLSQEAPETLTCFETIAPLQEPSVFDVANKSRQALIGRGDTGPDRRPVAILLPGMMGSHLKAPRALGGAEDNRVWFDLGDLIRGGLDDIRYGNSGVKPDGLFELFYGELANHLELSHQVIRFAYDWRAPIEDSATALAEITQQALVANPNQPIRFLAHGMGGLLVRAMIARHNPVWKQMIARSGSRLIMLGTPNNGTHSMVETLVGKSDTIRKVARVDLGHDMQGVLDIVAGFPGVLQLLPRPRFMQPSTPSDRDYFNTALWTTQFKNAAKDRWFGDGVAANPAQSLLTQTREFWTSTLPANTIENPECVAQVFGQAGTTPCGVSLIGEGESTRLMIEGTSDGDGVVTWASGRLDNLPQERCWFMPVSHGELTQSEAYFPAIVELLESGSTEKLGRLPVSRGGKTTTRLYDAGPATYPTAEELARSVFGGKTKHRRTRGKLQTLRVSVRAIDLHFVRAPIMCGHYIGDTIAGAEKEIDRLVNGALSQRERLGVYATTIGTSAVVLNVRTTAGMLESAGKGAVIVGLGEYGKLSITEITETVRAGVLRLLLHSRDLTNNDAELASEPSGLELSSLLIGQNSNTHVSVQDSVDAIVLGVCEANRQYADATQSTLRVSQLEFIEVYLDTAITAAHEVLGLPKRLEKNLRRLDAHLEPARQLIPDKGVRQRLQVSAAAGYWPRLIVTDADHTEMRCPPECYQVRHVSPIPEDVLRDLQGAAGAGASSGQADDGSRPAARAKPLQAPLAERLKYVFLSERARAEAVVLQRQPGLIEALVKDAIRFDTVNRDISHTLFHLMVPLEFKAAARQTEKLVLVVDDYTANMPWEMLVIDDQPMVLKTKMVRQLVSARYRQIVRSALRPIACVIGNPSTQGFYDQFPGQPDTVTGNALVNLPGAASEAAAVRETLEQAGYMVEPCPPEREALDVLNCLYKQPYRVLMIAAHGVFNHLAKDGKPRTGVVLSGGVLLTAVEIGQMEVVPEVVFLNCCHLGQMDGAANYNRLASSVSRELIQMGVRCVVAAGWQVNDEAASLFAQTFFTALAHDKKTFGLAIWTARKQTYDQFPNLNTWGAYQAYGDPDYVLDPTFEAVRVEADWTPVAPEELLDALLSLHLARTPGVQAVTHAVEKLLRKSPPEWSDLPAVQLAIAQVYSAYGPEGIEQARQALTRVISLQKQKGAMSMGLIEQLAQLEAQLANATGSASEFASVKSTPEPLAGNAIAPAIDRATKSQPRSRQSAPARKKKPR